MTIALEYTLRGDDFEPALAAQRAREHRQRRAVLAVATLSAVVVFAVTLPIQLALIGAAVLLAWTIAYEHRTPPFELPTEPSDEPWAWGRTYRARLDERGVAFTDPLHATYYRDWEMVSYWIDTDGGVLVFLSPRSMHPIPLDADASPEEAAAVRRLLAEKVGARGDAPARLARRFGLLRATIQGVAFVLLSATPIEAVARLFS